MDIQLSPIGKISTPYRQKFAIPRQPGLVKCAEGKITFETEFNDPNYLRGIEQFSHIWLLFHFHQTADKGHAPLVRPPRLGGNKKQGTFATRTTFRPNNIGMSVVEFISVEHTSGELSLHVRGVDLLDNTPILDIKPYLPYADKVKSARGGITDEVLPSMQVEFADSAINNLQLNQKKYPHLAQLITEVLSQDPRPAYRGKKDTDKFYAMTLYHFNIQWKVVDDYNHVFAIDKIK